MSVSYFLLKGVFWATQCLRRARAALKTPSEAMNNHISNHMAERGIPLFAALTGFFASRARRLPIALFIQALVLVHCASSGRDQFTFARFLRHRRQATRTDVRRGILVSLAVGCRSSDDAKHTVEVRFFVPFLKWPSLANASRATIIHPLWGPSTMSTQ
jgi:hypothetical protein